MIRTKNGQLYTGITTDVKRRFHEHQQNGLKTAKALRGKGPLELAFDCEVGNRSQALKLEAYVKTLTKQQKEHIVAERPDTLSIG